MNDIFISLSGFLERLANLPVRTKIIMRVTSDWDDSSSSEEYIMRMHTTLWYIYISRVAGLIILAKLP